MEILAGHGFDSRPPNRTPTRLGVTVVGPEGLLQQLEFRAGLVSPGQSRAERVVRYANALKAADGPARFYHRSFALDPLETARLLLDWRDFALDHGWSGQPGPQSPDRLDDLAAVEALADGISPCHAERLAALVARVGLIARAIDKLTLADEPADWTPPFRRLFAALWDAGVLIVNGPSPLVPGAPPDSDLGRLQLALIDRADAELTPLFNGDGSLRLYRCLEPHGCAAALVELLADLDDHLLVVGEHGFLIGAAARARGLPNSALGGCSEWRPPQQLLPLLLQIAWSPPGADAVLQYLTLPAGPYRGLRRRIAERFGDRPGYDRAAWQQIIDAFIQERAATEPTTDQTALRERITDWLPISTADSRERMPIVLAIELAERVRDHWQSALGHAASGGAPDTKELAAALQAPDAMACALRNWGEATIPREQLNRLMELAAFAGSCALGQSRQVSPVNCIESPEAARMAEHAPAHLVWWGPALGSSEFIPPFGPKELAALPDIPDDTTRQRDASARLTRALSPLIAATRSALVVIDGPASDLLRLHLDRLLPAGAWRPFEEDLLAGAIAGVASRLLADLPLPPAQRWWTTGLQIPCPRARESYSSLDALALEPYGYVLKYIAKLSEGTLIDLPSDAKLKGNLAHRLVQDWFETHPWTGRRADPATIDAWIEARLDIVIEANALPLAAAGRQAERLAFRMTMMEALARLLGHLEDAGVVGVQVETKLLAALPGMELEGTLDLLARLADGRRAIIDLKWGWESGRTDELKEGRFLQLACYARLAEAVDAAGVAGVAYFILKSATLLATSDRLFHRARVVVPDEANLTPTMVWQRLAATIDWRRGQLSEGRIELTGGGLTPTAESEPPADALPLLRMEPDGKNSQQSGRRKPSFKPIDTWRVMTGSIQP